MRIKTLTSTILLAAVLGGCASTEPNLLTAGALPLEGPVDVRWEDPNAFSEFRLNQDRWQASREGWLQVLAGHLRSASAAELQPGQQLQLTIVDIDRAGGFEPWLGPDYDDVRIMRDIYPPRMTVRYVLRDAGGATVSQGEARLSDPTYLTSTAVRLNSDPLRYEKQMIDTWVMREFGRRNAGR